MANVEKTSSGKYKFIATINYKQYSKTFTTKAEGYAWEVEIKAGNTGKTPNMTFGELLNKYVLDVSSKKKGERWERIRVEKFNREDPLTQVKLSELSTPHLAGWRDRRLKQVSVLSVLREWALLNHCLHIAVHEWHYLKSNPMTGLKKPAAPPHRDRLLTQDEISSLYLALNYTPDAELITVTSRVGAVFAFALETAMRAQEICNLEWSVIKGATAKIKASKTFAGVREVPLSKKALAIIKQCSGIDETLIFNIKTSQLDSLFRKAKAYALIDGLHFHDTRHYAITHLAKKLNVLELARMVGHKDLRMLQIYYNESASNLAKLLD